VALSLFAGLIRAFFSQPEPSGRSPQGRLAAGAYAPHPRSAARRAEQA
jgi:hypothetical protein